MQRQEQDVMSAGFIPLLDDATVTVDGHRIADLSGIVGNPRKPFLREEPDLAAAIGRLAMDRPDLLVTHDGPDVDGSGLAGWPSARQALERAPPTLLIRGHAHWDTPLASLANGTQVLNVDSRVVVLG